MTTIQRGFDPVRTFREHITFKIEAAALSTRANALKDRLKERFNALDGTYENENGSKFFDFPRTIAVAGKSFKGMELRRSAGRQTFNEEKAEKILKRKGEDVLAAAQSTYIDQDKIYRLLAEEKITEKELDSMFEQGDDTYAFWPVEGEVL